jgi:glyoxylase-like metal-dependent hydrolase (beta-lactamase superfamily II)
MPAGGEPEPEVAPGHPEVLRIVAPNPGPMTLEGTNTYVVAGDEGEGSGRAWVIDPGPADSGHAAATVAACDSRGGIAGILLTHSHADHAAGAELLDAPVLEPAFAHRAGLSAIPTPGHSRDHVCYLRGPVCFGGDLALGEGSSFVPPGGGSLAAYLDSLRRLRALDLELICPGHGPWILDPRAKLDEYLEHRLDRERKLLVALGAGERSRAKLLDAAWDDVPAVLRSAAAIVMEAHLEKLEAEGRLPADLGD